MLSTSDLLSFWADLQPNRCKKITDLGNDVFAVYFDGTFQIIKPRDMSPSLTAIEQCFLVRSVMQAASNSGVYSVKIETIRKHRLLYQCWIDHDDIEVSGYSEEVDLSDALLRAYTLALEKEDLLSQELKDIGSEHSFFEGGSYVVSADLFKQTTSCQSREY
jgi:hypothetical protein